MLENLKPLTERQRTLARHLASGMTGVAACKLTKTNEVTLYRWRKMPHFQSYLNELIEAFERDAMQSLHSLRSKAVARLGDILQSSHEGTALRAAESILTRTDGKPLPESWGGGSADSTTWNQVQNELERIRKLSSCETPE